MLNSLQRQLIKYGDSEPCYIYSCPAEREQFPGYVHDRVGFSYLHAYAAIIFIYCQNTVTIFYFLTHVNQIVPMHASKV